MPRYFVAFIEHVEGASENTKVVTADTPALAFLLLQKEYASHQAAARGRSQILVTLYEVADHRNPVGEILPLRPTGIIARSLFKSSVEGG